MPPAATTLDASTPSDYAFDWALVDVETSGLVPRRDRILSIAVVTIGPDGRQTGEFTTLLDPGCDPGPVHIHGLTAERLSGAPTFEQVAGQIGALLQDRVMVAHNAQFDYDFLAHEFARARLYLPVAQRLCNLALNRRVDPPTADMSLASLAAHYGVPQTKAHDALDDTRVLAGIFRASLSEAARLDLPLPLVTCPPRQDPQFAPSPPKTPCAYRNPGRLEPGGPLVQGMKISITGETATARAELVARSVAAGLNMMTSVSRHTSALVTNDTASGSAKARRALSEGVPVIDEHSFLTLLKDVRPGTPHEKPALETPTAATAPTKATPTPTATAQPVAPASDSRTAESAPGVPAPRQPETPRVGKPFGRRRVLVLGGSHEEASGARARVVERGGAAAINLSAGVTDIVLLPGGERDRRMARVASLGLPVHDSAWLDAPTSSDAPVSSGVPAQRGTAAQILPRGGVIDLPTPGRWSVGASWAQQTNCEIDVVAFIVDEEEQVSCDEDFVFYGAPESPDGAVRLLCDGPTEQTIAVDLAALPPAARKVVIAAAIDGAATFGDIGAVQATLAPSIDAAVLAQTTVDAATSERTLLLAEIYRRGPVWRFRAVGQGYDHGLDGLARGYGVDVKE
ncbi:TerD family protein [Streptomyces sp. ISL-36]|uniref:TerD family protein n=1 Tax=Streptomyces sp. ISL-36 TaxID=2819182 RepID=UPI001BEC06BF|nr:TerD family protein [Streptomyces sp. ISL-36]MBT2443445.1 TerD family protein [Streptomyces sp. ISL-36]